MICRFWRRKFKSWSVAVCLCAAWIILCYNYTHNEHSPETVDRLFFAGYSAVSRETDIRENVDGLVSANISMVSRETASGAKQQNRINITTGYGLAKFAEEMCRNLTNKNNESFETKRMMLLPREHTLYCPVEKVGTTFWRRVLYMINNRKKVRHPYEVDINRALAQKHICPGLNSTVEDYISHFKFFFVRNPYKRVLSAYIDKVFAPNPMFWDRFGKDSVKKYRINDTRKCFHDVTFAEFVQFVVWSIRTSVDPDSHFHVAAKLCTPCSLHYSFIGKMESFKEDAIFLLQKFNLQHSVPQLKENFKQLSDEDALKDSIYSPFYWRKDIQKCMTWEEAMKRVWRKLQMRGFIAMNQTLAYFIKPKTALTKENILKAAKLAQREADPVQMKKQKKDVFISMYKTLPLSVLSDLRDTFEEDFRLFNYDPLPNEIFDRSVPVSVENYESLQN